ncbi:hypothetical protein N7509_010042 [Penicillium cosmopolitanum]|uniref:Uncharacterized protein n=1 Tax=Penicillium cosmopolitanum TaxID=1131564 RepID=A0A9X0B496_9EURO|nr:uncharacterized protein N7509_010042 [Penicillium cosmopolitanum]KAJ5387501.1 hypothetical protein N7509_010042 [Penicillium cosmopolitanum]
MATAHGSTTHLPTGPMAATAAITADEVQEYERILKISDDIFAGSHPRLRVPQQFVRKPTARNVQNGTASTQVAKTKPSNALTEHVAFLETSSESPRRSQGQGQGPVAGNLPSTATRIAPKPASEIDPIFLTKSDDLVRAELQLQRQRLERTLRDQTDQLKYEVKNKLAAQDTKPGFNVSQLLERALQIANPVSMGEPSETNGPSDSFDENSFYSSRAPDSTPPLEEQRRPSPPVALTQVADTAKRAPVEPYADELQRLEALNRTGSDQEMQDAYSVADQRVPYSQKQPLPAQDQITHQPQEPQQIDALDEPEYSPPAPIAPPLNQRAPRYQGVAGSVPRPRYTEQTRFAQEPVSPANNVKVVRNHITSPAAPRPSRVSPLATAKVPSVQQLRDERHDHDSDRIYSDPDSGRGSPNGPAPHIVSRKRRRLQGRGEDSPQVSSRIVNPDINETFIKEEPVSPPPFADDPAIVRNRTTQERPVYIDIASPQYTPVAERQEHHAQRQIYEPSSYHQVPVDQGPPRAVSSRMSTRRPIREDDDLRRVASMQYASRSEYPREYLPVDPNSSRAASYSVIDRPQPEHPGYYEEVPHSYGPRYVAVDDMSQPIYREPYYEEAPPQRVMAAPRRRIVDENGVEYEEVIPAHRMQPMAPPPRPMSRIQRVDTYDDRVPVRAPSVRAQSVVQDPYIERRYVQEMPPPQPQYYRRVMADYARPVANDRRYAAPLEGGHEPYSRSGSVQVAEYVPRHSTYVDEPPAPPSERVMRTASVRPQLARYEEPHEIPQQRVGSIRPGHSRDVSVIMDDRLMGDYVERPYYIRERRFYDGEDGRSRVALDGAADSVQRVQVPRHY